MSMATHKIEIVPYEEAHGLYISRHMRLSDRREIWALAALRPLPAIEITMASAVSAYTALVDGVPALMWGVARRTFISDVGVPFLLGTDVADEHQFRFGKESKKYFTVMTEEFPVMENFALATNTKTLRWLKWLGFDIEEPKQMGLFNCQFVRFGRGLECA